MLFTVVSCNSCNSCSKFVVTLAEQAGTLRGSMWLSTCPSARIFMSGMTNAVAHVYRELLILDGHQAAFVWGLEFL